MSARLEFLSRLRRKVIAGGGSGEYRDVAGAVTWLPDAGQSAQQISDANAIIAAYDQVADDAQRLTEERASADDTLAGADGKLVRAVVLCVLDEFNTHALKINAILDAVDAATTLADLKTRVAAIADYPQRTAAQLKNAVRNKIDSGSADA